MKQKPSNRLGKYDPITRELVQSRIDLLVALRKLCQLTQEEASTELGIERSTLTKYENGQHDMSMSRFVSICTSYQKYITEHHIKYSEKVLDLADRCRIFQ